MFKIIQVFNGENLWDYLGVGWVMRRESASDEVCKSSVCSRNSPQPCLDPPKSEWHDGQMQINEAGKCIRENTALRTKFRGDVRVQACHAAVC